MIGDYIVLIAGGVFVIFFGFWLLHKNPERIRRNRRDLSIKQKNVMIVFSKFFGYFNILAGLFCIGMVIVFLLQDKFF
ncbi:hypothetical protein [Marispirochaeta sp.]|uniref:hypothetical protein n=1 Tax=Marispirochaeta sp. TaxID=2038653 RepID=UPI0029C9959D|nr:hypothetical protein [Marispirochaeta sp.]